MPKYKREIFGEIPKRDVISKLVRYYRELEDYLKDNIFNITVYNYDRQMANREIMRLERKMRVFNAQVYDFFEINISKTFIQARRKISKRIERVWKKRVSRDINPQRAIDRQLKAVTKTFLRANNSIIKTAKQYFKVLESIKSGVSRLELQEFDIDDIREEVQGMVRVGLKEHVAEGYVKRDIKSYLNKVFEGQSLIQINSKVYKPHKYAEMLARTEMRTAQTNGTLVSCKEYGVELVIFSTHGSPCKICSPLEGNIYSIAGRSSKYESLDSGVAPPVHPNCEHNLDPYDELQGSLF